MSKARVLEQCPYAACWRFSDTETGFIVTLDMHSPRREEQYKAPTARQAWAASWAGINQEGEHDV